LGGYFYNRSGVKYEGRNKTITDPTDIDWERPLDGHALDNGFDVFKGLPVAIGRPPYIYMDGNRLQYFDTLTNEYRNALNTDSFHFFIKDELNAGLTVGTTAREGLGDPSYTQLQCEPKMIQEAEDYIADRVGDSDPFFMYVALYSPHKPWQVTPAFQDSTKSMTAWEELLMPLIIMDSPIIQLSLSPVTTDRRPLLSTTVEIMVRTPTVRLEVSREIAGKGVVQAGTTSDVLMWQGDIFRTLADIFGDCLPQNVAPDAVSILSILNGSATTVSRNAVVTAGRQMVGN